MAAVSWYRLVMHSSWAALFLTEKCGQVLWESVLLEESDEAYKRSLSMQCLVMGRGCVTYLSDVH